MFPRCHRSRRLSTSFVNFNWQVPYAFSVRWLALWVLLAYSAALWYTTIPFARCIQSQLVAPAINAICLVCDGCDVFEITYLRAVVLRGLRLGTWHCGCQLDQRPCIRYLQVEWLVVIHYRT